MVGPAGYFCVSINGPFFDNLILGELRKHIKQGINIELPTEVKTHFQNINERVGGWILREV
mgnify:CR=1 FL=1